ncbi:SET domain-containing protein [Sparassis crispa]|uniref:SET domain-containing protein n=1 Tax=Sparassis crispa TaxID=139825 RepID=A0A401GW19_9APHY|nr:SET domain-containing protein [Sparassis crispa]GBE86390.1 SET domain-containing protein [Sparassis crispa]
MTTAPIPQATWQEGLRVQTDPRVGRTYHTTHAIPANSTVIEATTPYACTIWKQFRAEVCAECWRYDGGRRGFLTRRDDEGLHGPRVETSAPEEKGEKPGTILDHRERSGPSAGLWFCGEHCQSSWMTREGMDTLQLLRTLEEARRKKVKEKVNESAEAALAEKPALTRTDIEHAWDETRQKERSPKEVRRWREIQLDDFETDMARYVLLALVHLYREQGAQHLLPPDTGQMPAFEKPLSFGGATWREFEALQSNELRHLQTYPELLEDQIRIYQALQGRFGLGGRRRGDSAAEPAAAGLALNGEGGKHKHARVRNGKVETRVGRWEAGSLRGVGSVITVENVRMALGVDPGNSFGIWEVPITEESECLGFGVYPRPSLFNHHCMPNVKKERNGRVLRFITTRNVDADEELCISYGHVEQMDWRERRKELQEGWFFQCRCSRCVTDMATEREACGVGQLRPTLT